MSAFINFQAFPIPLGSTIATVRTEMKNRITAAGWQLVAEDVANQFLDFLPPITEAVGTSKFQEVVRISFTTAKIQVGSYLRTIADAYPQRFLLWGKTAGAAQAAIAVDGTTVSQDMSTVAAGNTAADNIRYLYYALKASIDPRITSWEWTMNGNGGNVYGTAKAVSASPKTVTPNANINYQHVCDPVPAGMNPKAAHNDNTWTGDNWTMAWEVNADLVNGFNIYLQINARTIHLGTKTAGGYYGPVFATYIDHPSAMANTPAFGDCSPIELYTGLSGEDNNVLKVRPTHVYAMWSGWGYYNPATCPQYTGGGHPLHGGRTNTVVQDWTPWPYIYSANMPASRAEFQPDMTGVFTMDAHQNIFNAQQCAQGLMTGEWNGGGGVNSYYVPPAVFEDLWKWNGTHASETVFPVTPWQADPWHPVANRLAEAMDSASDPATLALDSTAGLFPTGYIQRGVELIRYSGIAGNTLTGVQRAQFGTLKQQAYAGDPVLQSTWLMKFNNAAIFAGYEKPA